MGRVFVYILYCVEGGLFLALVPWTRWWLQIYYFERFPALGRLGLAPITRGVVSGVGVALFLHGIWVLGRGFARKRPRTPDRAEP